MKNVVACLVMAACGTASAQNLHLAVKVSADGGSTWQSDAFALRGSSILVGIWMSGDANIYGMGGGTMRLNGTSMITGDSVAFADGTDTGRVGPFNFGAATNAIFRDTADTFRIDAASDAANSNSSAGMTFFQRDPATAVPGTFSTANPALCFRFNVTIGAAWAPDRDIVMSIDQLSRGVASYFTAANASRPATAAATFSSAVIHVYPAPGSVAAMGLFAALSGRRRRPSAASV